MARPLFIFEPGPGGQSINPGINVPILPAGPLILPPKDMKVKSDGGMVRLVAIERGGFISTSGILSGAVQYIFKWTAEADATTQAGRVAAFTRGEVVGIVARTYVDGQELPSGSLADSRFASGFFMCAGSNGDDLSDDVIFSASQSGDILDSSIPGPVTELQISEDGEQANGTIVSVLSFTYIAPNPKNSFIGIQPVIADYPALGDLTEFGPLGYGGPAGGAGGGLLRIVPARRIGDGTITITTATVAGTGTHFTLFAKAGEQIEVFGVLRRIFAVNNDGSMTLDSSWPATPAVTNVGQYAIIGRCRVYAVALSQLLAHSVDQTTWPFVDVDIDGVISPPNAPATLTLSRFGNGIRGQFAQVAGTAIRGYIVYRSAGLTNDITTATQVGLEIRHDPTTPNGGTVLQFEDSNFTSYDREYGNAFRYYVRTINVRDMLSSGYATATVSPRVDAGGDGGDPEGKLGLKNLLFNGAFGGTVGNVILANDTSQDAFFAVIAGVDVPGRPYDSASGQAYGIGRFRGYTHWESGDAGTGAAGAVKFYNGSEARFDAPGAAKTWFLWQEVEAWDSNAAAPPTPFIKVKKDSVCCWAVKVAKDPGSAQPNGTVTIVAELYSNGTFQGYAPKRYRDSATDALLFATGSAARVDISGADLLSDWVLFFGVFRLDSSVGTVRQVRFAISWFDGTQGKVRVCEAMVNDGEERGIFTPDMGDVTVSIPVPVDPPGPIGDGDGHPHDRIPLEP